MAKTRIDPKNLDFLKISIMERYDRDEDLMVEKSTIIENRRKFNFSLDFLLDGVELDLESSRVQYPLKKVPGINPFVFRLVEGDGTPPTELEFYRICKTYNTYMPPRWIKRIKRGVHELKRQTGIPPAKEEITRIAREQLSEQIEESFKHGSRYWLTGAIKQKKGEHIWVYPKIFIPELTNYQHNMLNGRITWFERVNTHTRGQLGFSKYEKIN